MKKIILMFTIFFGFSYSSIVEANPFGNIKNPLSAITGGDEAEEEAPTLNIDEAQAQLIISLQSALSDVLKAQAMIEEAKGNKEKAAELNNTANNILGDSISQEDIKGALTLSSDTVSAQSTTFEEGQEMSDDAKSAYAKALAPYLTSVARTAALSEPIGEFMNAAQNQLKSIRNPMEIRKLKGTLQTGMFIGKTVPKLIVNLGKSTVGLLSFAKKNGLDVRGAEKKVGELELDIE